VAQLSYARLVLSHWGIVVEDIPTSDREKKKEADFFANFGDVRVLIEEKTKEDDPEYLSIRAQKLAQGEVVGESIPIVRSETLSGIIRDAAKQLRSSSDKPHDFRLVWFTATGVHARAKYEQFMATLYGRTNILEMNADGYRRCYYFRQSDFFRRAASIDGAVVAYTDGTSLEAQLCLNSLSPRYAELRQSAVMIPFGAAVEDPMELEADGTAFVLDSDLNRNDEGPLLAYLQTKYRTRPLMKFDLGYMGASVLASLDEP
jgi:hypothetical protein